MTTPSTPLSGSWPCPFRMFHCCPDGEVGNKGISRLISHLKRLHLSSDERRSALREAISTDHGLFKNVEGTLKFFGQWMCGKCLSIHALSRACHHPDGLVRFTNRDNDIDNYIIGISRPSPKAHVTNVHESFLLDTVLLDRVFKAPIVTALKTALYKVVAQPRSVEAWVRLFLLPRCTLQVVRPKNRQERRSGNRKALQQRSILNSLATWGKEDGIFMLLKNIFDSPTVGSLGPKGVDNPEESSVRNTNVRQCLRKVADGHFTAAVKVLCSSGVAPYNDNTIQALEAKHPYREPPSIPGTIYSEPPLVAEVDSVLCCIKSFPKGTSCGRDGLRAQHILDAFCGEGSAIATDLLCAITAVAMKGVGKEMTKYLNDFQFGVGVSGGAEAILHSVNRVLSERHTDGSLAMLTVDFSNAFNQVDRSALLREVRMRCPSISLWVEFLYGQPARLYLGDGHIWSTTGVQQGDPLGPLLFALVLHPLVHQIRDKCKLLLHAWYLDDGTVIGGSEEVARVLDIIKVSGPALGLELNIKNTELFWPSCDGSKFREGLFPKDIGRPLVGVKLLGGAVSRDASFISGLAKKRAAKAVDLMRLLPKLGDPQSELLLLRSCMGIAKLFFGLRTCQPVHMEDAALFFDKGLREAIEELVVCGGPFFGDLQWRLASLPIRFGGLGLYSAAEASSYAFVASRAQSWVLQDHILRDSGICGMDSDYVCALACLRDTIPSFDFSGFTNKDTAPPKAQHALASALFSKIVHEIEVQFDLTVRQRAVFECLRAPHAQDFLLAIPIDGLGQHMSPVEYRTILKYRLMIPLFPVDEVCPVCHKACLDSFGEHAVHCKELPGFKYRHDLVRDVLFDIFRSTLRPADILVFGWVGGKHACVDLTGVFPLVGLGSSAFTVGQAALKAASGKVIKHEKACLDNQHMFIPFAFDTFGFLAPEAVDLLSRVQRVMHSNVMTPRSMDVVFKRLSFAIQKGVAAQLVARLPTISM
ncbi:putative reverse transcriptase domain, exostosin [Helianthus anomalus]